MQINRVKFKTNSKYDTILYDLQEINFALSINICSLLDQIENKLNIMNAVFF